MLNFLHLTLVKFLQKIPGPDLDDFLNLTVTSLSKGRSLVKTFYEYLISSFHVKLLTDKTDAR